MTEKRHHDDHIRKSVFQSDPEAATEKWIGFLESRGLLRFRGEVLPERGYENEPSLLAVWQDVTSSTLSAIGAHFCVDDEARQIFVSPVRSGNSGASVLRLRYHSPDSNLEARGVLLKLSRDRDSLSNEYQRYRDEYLEGRKLHTDLIVGLHQETQPFTANGWSALGIKYLPNSRTFLDWVILERPTAEEIGNLLARLFLEDSLASCYRSNLRIVEKDCLTYFSAHQLTPLRRARIGVAIEELSGLVEKYWTSGESLGLTCRFAQDPSRLGSIASTQITPKTQSTVQHGDLHGRNVLVQLGVSSARPRIIDYATGGHAPWASDVARLAVDVFLGALAAGNDAYEWEHFEGWMSFAPFLTVDNSNMHRAEPTSNPQIGPVKSFLEWIQSNVFSVTGVGNEPKHVAEYELAVAIEFLRSTYRVTVLPAPKRALALALSEVFFRSAEARFISLASPVLKSP